MCSFDKHHENFSPKIVTFPLKIRKKIQKLFFQIKIFLKVPTDTLNVILTGVPSFLLNVERKL